MILCCASLPYSIIPSPCYIPTLRSRPASLASNESDASCAWVHSCPFLSLRRLDLRERQLLTVLADGFFF